MSKVGTKQASQKGSRRSISVEGGYDDALRQWMGDWDGDDEHDKYTQSTEVQNNRISKE